MPHIASYVLGLFTAAGALVACGSSSDDDHEHEHTPEAFSLRFVAAVDGNEVGCTDDLGGFGPDQADHIGINDLRFYISNLTFLDAEGNALDIALDTNEFQYTSEEGSVALIDLTGTTEGSCAADSIAFGEGTARTNQVITGTTIVDHVASISFDVGVPQAVMKATIATNTPEGAPSPLNEMYWNWNSGYRHVVFNFTVKDAGEATGGGYLHLGSRDCAPNGEDNALSDRDVCTYVNTPKVAFDSFDLASDTVGLDLRKALEGIDLIAPIYDPVTFEVIGQGPGVECHSSPMQDDCPSIFESFGIDMDTGTATAANDAAFVKL